MHSILTLTPIPVQVRPLNDRLWSIHERIADGQPVSSDDLDYLSECEEQDNG